MRSFKVKQYLPIAALTTAAILWGANTPVMKLTLAHIPLFSLGFLRFFIAALLLYPFVRKNLSYKRADLFSLFICAFLGITIIITLFFLGLKMTSALNSGIIGGTVPIFILLCAYLFLHEKITKRMVIGTVIGLIGLCVIVGKDVFTQGFDVSPLGDTLVLLANVAFAIYITMSKELSKKYPPLTLTFFIFFVGSLFFLPGVFLEFQTNPTWYTTVPPLAYLGVFYGIVFSALIAFTLWQYGLSKVSETQVGFFLYLSPLVSSIIAILFLGETATEEFLIGTILIFIGLLIAEAHLHHKKPLHH